MTNNHAIGAENVRWDLSVLYSGVDDLGIDSDIREFEKLAADFYAVYRGVLAHKLGEAIVAYSGLGAVADKPMNFLFLTQSLQTGEPKVKAKLAQCERVLAEVSAKYLTFFELEIMELPQEVLDGLYVSDERVLRYKPWIEQVRMFQPNRLSEPVESALTLRSPFTSGAWADFFDELESDLRFPHAEGEKTLAQMLDILSNSSDEATRAKTLEVIHDGLGGAFHKYSAQTLYMVAGLSAVERRERSYAHPMEPRNKSNMVTDETVQALHAAVVGRGSELAKRYYRLKARILKKDVLEWSDRNAPLPFADTSIMPYEQALSVVLDAYRSFSPTLAAVIEESFVVKKTIDAPATIGKRGGAFNASMVLPNGTPLSFTLLNYLGSSRDVMTLAHELGHGVHGMLAGREQGPLMFHAPIAYCETASVFGEMTTFNFLRERLQKNADVASNLALLTSKIEDALNTVVRQIGFSNFERRLHGMDATYTTWGEPVKMSPEELDSVWMQTLRELYGQEGEVFRYTNAQRLWAYVGHFHRPFYVYGYAFGELVTQSLYAQKEQLGERFEPLYLELLKAGGTKNIVELLRPFGLDPAHPEFWERGLQISLERWITEAENMFDSM